MTGMTLKVRTEIQLCDWIKNYGHQISDQYNIKKKHETLAFDITSVVIGEQRAFKKSKKYL